MRSILIEFPPYGRPPDCDMQKHLITIAVTIVSLIVWEKMVKPRL